MEEIKVPAVLRAADPLYAGAIDAFNSLQKLIDAQSELIEVMRGRLSNLEADNATLRAQLSSRGAA